MKLLIDMNLTPRWTRWLADAKIEAVHWSQMGAMDAPDTEIMTHAVRGEGFIVFTHDLDFSAILAASHDLKPSVVQIRGPEIRPEIVGDIVVRALRQVENELQSGALLTVDPNRVRLRILPL